MMEEYAKAKKEMLEEINSSEKTVDVLKCMAKIMLGIEYSLDCINYNIGLLKGVR